MTAPAPDLVPIDFVTHARVAVDAPPAVVWALVTDPDRAARSQRMIPLDETAPGPGGVGRRFAVVMRDTPDLVAFHAVDVELEPLRRRTFRMETTAGTFMGFASWLIEPRDGGVTLGYDVYARYDVLPGHVEMLTSGGQKMMDDNLLRLKGLAEAEVSR